MPGPDTLPFFNYRFEVEVTSEDGHTEQLGPSFVSHLQAPRYVPGLFRLAFLRPRVLSELTLRRGVTDDKYLFDWHQAMLAGKREKREVRVKQFGREAGEPVNAWTLKKCYPVRWQGPEFDAQHADAAYEEVVLVYPTIEWSVP